ncbi:phosphotransferase [Hamadaea sp. NPDC051192]|uniref:phosphotransferase family protein n=1 Tax=Hamadaea sp. NPDC051192 TaxID=3154940 RepID=UPI0034453539
MIPYTETAQRPDWEQLPESLRTAIAERLGGEVASARVARSGFTQGFAAVLTTVAGFHAFVKAAPLDLTVAEWYAQEARITEALPVGVPVPRVRWATELAGHFVICLDAVDGAHMPELPWRAPDLAAALDAYARTAALLTPMPAALAEFAPDPFSAVMRGTLDRWAAVLSGAAELPDPRLEPHLAELARLERRLLDYGDAMPGVMHCDLRADNVILDTTGAAWICDWNHLCRGPAWLDLVSLLISAAPDHDVDTLFTTHPAVAGAPEDALDATLAGLAGYYLTQGMHPEIPTSPYVRTHQRHCGRLAIEWLARRQKWRW